MELFGFFQYRQLSLYGRKIIIFLFNNAFFSVLLYIHSPIIIHAALFDGCDTCFNLKPGVSYLQSPYYPNNYLPGSSCRYKFTAPLDYDITLNCTIDLPKNPNSCSTELLFLSIDGDKLLRGSEEFCGQGNFIRKSLFRSIVLAYTSYGSSGRFQCRLNVAPQPCDCGWSVNTKIVNGKETQIHEYPNMVALRNLDSFLYVSCGGVIISHRYIVTAAHCTRYQPDASKLLAYVGLHNLTNINGTRYAEAYEIESIIEHPDYTSDSVQNDIALLFTKRDIEWSRGVGPICLPVTEVENTFAYYYVDVIGWGTTSFGGKLSDVLRKITLQILNNFNCQREQPGNAIEIYPTQICTFDYTGQGRDSCQFDSGGPIILRTSRQFLLGIISFGRVCGEGGYAIGVNTRITSYLDWIYRNIGFWNVCTKKIHNTN